MCPSNASVRVNKFFYSQPPLPFPHPYMLHLVPIGEAKSLGRVANSTYVEGLMGSLKESVATNIDNEENLFNTKWQVLKIKMLTLN